MDEALCKWRRAVIIDSFDLPVMCIENENREDLYTVVARKLDIHVDAIILYYKKKYVTCRTIPDDVDRIELHLAVKQPGNREVMQVFGGRFSVTCLYPIIVRNESGIQLNEIFSLFNNTFVKDIIGKINHFCEHNKFILNGRFLSPSEYLADLYFESGVL